VIAELAALFPCAIRATTHALRVLQPSDADFYQSLYANHTLMRWISPSPADLSAAAIQRSFSLAVAPPTLASTRLFLMIVDKDNHAVGLAGASWHEAVASAQKPAAVELGVVLSQSSWGKNLATATFLTLLEQINAVLPNPSVQIWLQYDARNLAMSAVSVKLVSQLAAIRSRWSGAQSSVDDALCANAPCAQTWLHNAGTTGHYGVKRLVLTQRVNT
jgi:RimJ/RimL family protein N-acetyltransferase